MILIYTRVPIEYNTARNALSLREDAKTNQYRFSINQNKTIGLFFGKPNRLIHFLTEDFPKTEIESLIDTGTCGALNISLKIGTIVISTESLSLSEGISVKVNQIPPLTPPLSQIEKGINLTLSSPLDKAENRDKLLKEKKIFTCNMESAEIFKIANSLNIPSISIRVVSDWCEGKSLRLFKKSALAHLPRLYKSIQASLN